MAGFDGSGSSKPESESRPAIDDYDGIEALNFEGSKVSGGSAKKPKKQPVIPMGKREVPGYFEMLKNHEDFDKESERLSAEVMRRLERYKPTTRPAQENKISGGTLEFIDTDFKKMETSDLRDQYEKCKGEARAGNTNDQIPKRLISIAEELARRNLLSSKKVGLLRQEFNING
jgi:hypothetical protein